MASSSNPRAVRRQSAFFGLRRPRVEAGAGFGSSFLRAASNAARSAQVAASRVSRRSPSGSFTCFNPAGIAEYP